MSRKKHSLYKEKQLFGRRAVLPDLKYNSTNITRFINNLMLDGKKMVAQKAVYIALERMAKEQLTDKSPAEVMDHIISLIKPDVIVRSKRVRGATYQVPLDMNTSEYRQFSALSIGIKWMVAAIRSRKNKPLHIKIFDEFVAIVKGEGNTINKRNETKRAAQSNIAFAHLG